MSKRYSSEFRDRAVRLVAECRNDHASEFAAIKHVASKLGADAETVRKWIRRAEVDAGPRRGLLGLRRPRDVGRDAP